MTNSYPVEIASALHDVMGKVGYVQKKGRNEFHKYNYAGEGDLLEALRPAMVEAGLILIPSLVESTGIDEYGNTRVVVEYTLAHKSGAVWPDKIKAAGCGNDKNSKGGVGDKGTYKALTGANKYLLFKLFQIETGDDPEKTEAEPPPPASGNGSAKPPPKADQEAWGGPLGKTELKKALQEFNADLLACADADTLHCLLDASKAVTEQCKRDLPGWWWTKEGSDAKGFHDRINDRMAELLAAEPDIRG